MSAGHLPPMTSPAVIRGKTGLGFTSGRRPKHNRNNKCGAIRSAHLSYMAKCLGTMQGSREEENTPGLNKTARAEASVLQEKMMARPPEIEVARRTYERWEQSGKPEGRDHEGAGLLAAWFAIQARQDRVPFWLVRARSRRHKPIPLGRYNAAMGNWLRANGLLSSESAGPIEVVVIAQALHEENTR